MPVSPRILVPAAAAAILAIAGGFLALRHKRASEPAFLQRPATWVREIRASEEAHDAVAGAVKASFIGGLRERDRAAALGGLAADFRGIFPAPSAGTPVPDEGMEIREFGAEAGPELDGPAFVQNLLSHAEGWISVERTTWRTFTFLLDPGGRKAYLEAHFQLAGPAPDGSRSDLQAVVAGEAVLEGGGWKLRRLRLLEGCAIRCPWTAFADITDATGFHFNESAENRRQSQAIINDRALKTSGGLAALDWNRDGHWDLLATVANRHTVLFVNDGRGGFVRNERLFATPEESGFMVAVVDLDGDGQEEMATTQILSYQGTTARAALYTRRGDTWQPVPGGLEFRLPPGRRDLTVQAVVPHDVDGDGDLDLLYGVYSDSESGKSRYNAVAAYDGADNLLFINQGGLHFTEESDARGIRSTQYTLAAQFFDLDGDGDDDLLEGNDFGPDIVWENVGKGLYREKKDHLLARDSTYTMGISIADWDNTGAWSVYISNMYSHAGNRIVPLAETLSDDMRRIGRILAQGNEMFEVDPATGAWRESGIQRNVNWADWAWACPFLDVDNDGDREIFVANGYTSFEDPKAPDW